MDRHTANQHPLSESTKNLALKCGIIPLWYIPEFIDLVKITDEEIEGAIKRTELEMKVPEHGKKTVAFLQSKLDALFKEKEWRARRFLEIQEIIFANQTNP